MSNNTTPLSVQNQSHTSGIGEASYSLDSSVKLVKNESSGGDTQSFSENLQTNLAHDTVTFSSGTAMEMNEAEMMESSSMVFNRDGGVMYINTDGNVIFNPKGISSSSSEPMPITLSSGPEGAVCLEDSSSINQNYLVVVEDPGASQPLSSDFGPSIILSSEATADTSLAQTGPGPGVLKPDDVDHSHQQTIMVLDSQFGSDGILIDPNVLVAYENTSGERMSFNTESALESAGRPLAALPQGSFIHLESASLPDDSSAGGSTHFPVGESELHKSSQPHIAQPSQTIVIANRPGPHSGIEEEGLGFEKEKSGLRGVMHMDVGETENSKLLQQKEELRMLEKSHLQHHMKEVKKKLCSQSGTDDLTETSMNCQDEEPLDEPAVETDHAECLQSDADDEISVFSNITATINADLLAHVPGCQRFLLEKIEQSSLSSQLNLSFRAEAECTFSGSLRSLIDVHNGLRKEMDMKGVSLLSLTRARDEKLLCDQGVMCGLLQPYISSRGRQPRYSYKAKAMGYMSDFESLTDAETAEYVDESPHRSTSRQRKRKRGRPRKVVRSAEKDKIKKQATHTSQVSPLRPSAESPKKEEVPSASDSGVQSVAPPEISRTALPDMSDPLQQRLLEEQIKYRKRIESRVKDTQPQGSKLSPLDDAVLADTEVIADDGGGEDPAQMAPEPTSPDAKQSADIPKKRRGRPPKYGGPLEKVQPRNPLTESESTKQMRAYEENLAFRFFCKHCSFKTKRRSHFLIHLRCHKDGTEKKYRCTNCDFVTISITSLKRHELKHKENLFTCKICAAYQTDKEALLLRHMRDKHKMNVKNSSTITDLDSLQCDQCSFHGSTEKELAQHKLAHSRLAEASPKPVYSCPECKKTLRRKMHLRRHLRDVHGPELRPHLCDECGKAFKRTDALKQHMILHETKGPRELPFKCATCGKAFRSMAHLKEHQVIHTSERPYLCQYCGAAFKTQAVQKRHILTLHIKPRAHVCSVCCRQFNTKHALQRHENTHLKPDVQEPAVMVTTNAMEDGQQESLDEKEKRAAISVIEAQVTDMALEEEAEGSGHIPAAGAQVAGCLVQEMMGASAGQAGIEDQMGSENQRLPQAYIQGSQDSTTLYYFTGDLQSL